MGQSKQTKGGLFSALFGFLAFFFQAAAPAPTVDFSVKNDVFCADEKGNVPLALGHDGQQVRSRRAATARRAPTKRRRLKDGEYVGGFLDVMA